MTLPEQARALHEEWRDFHLDRPIVVGFSYGGPVALAYAEEFPDDVRALVLVASLADPGAEHLHNPVQRVIGFPVIGSLLAWTVGPLLAPGQMEEGLKAAFAPDPVDPACLQSALNVWTSPRALLASAGDWPSLDASLPEVARRYGEIKVPIEVLVAEKDTLVGPAHTDYIREHLPTAKITMIAGRNHMLVYTEPGAIADAIERAAARCATPTAAPK